MVSSRISYLHRTRASTALCTVELFVPTVRAGPRKRLLPASPRWVGSFLLTASIMQRCASRTLVNIAPLMVEATGSVRKRIETSSYPP